MAGSSMQSPGSAAMQDRGAKQSNHSRDSRNSQDLLASLSNWVEAGALRAVDLAFTRFIAEEGGVTDPDVLLAVALTSERNGHGHVCLDLGRALGSPDRLLSRLRDDTDLSPGVREQLRSQLAGLPLQDWVSRLANANNVIAVMMNGMTGLGHGADPIAPEAKSTAEDTARLEPAPTERSGSPLVLAGSAERPLLYLRRYWQYEQRIRAGIQARVVAPVEVDPARLDGYLDTLFGRSASPQMSQASEHQAASEHQEEPDCQRIACERAASRRFFIITGGPGTGKTTTVVRLLALLQRLAMSNDSHQAAAFPTLRIELAAPTGKAAARLTESIAGQLHELPCGAEAWGPIPTQVKTLHRLLGTIPNSRHFRHHAANPLPADVVVVDEASMVDVEMMAHLLDALRPDARLILLGDKDQLSSVEAGAVLGDLCQPAHQDQQTQKEQPVQAGAPALPCGIETGSGLGQAIVILSHSYRFSQEGGIGALASLVNHGEVLEPQGQSHQEDQSDQEERPDQEGPLNQPPTPTSESAPKPLANVLKLFKAKQDQALGVIEALVITDTEDAAFTRLMAEAYGVKDSFLHQLRNQAPPADAAQAAFDQWAADILQAQKRFQLLTPLRQGVWGVEGLNQRIISLLRQRGWLGEAGEYNRAMAPRQWFPGRPVMVTRNDYSLNLMNGDIGITLSVPAPVRCGNARAAASILRVAFPTTEGGVRWVLPSRLQAVETVFAMTVHKAQGSEFEHTALILPDKPNPVLTRELLYTAITRAKSRFTLLYSQEAVLVAALTGRVERASGLQGGWV
ncbi:exodeoxyribonuclease V subunit alpha [Lamprobacter modestohalophilus]|uniref:exodeoxyribonuclease V subunit alpha n=1 Tax=Lamprobacter modestohalophilus TaxID=1064514 RepID=UPI002ADEC5A8|nr:exodeoxyribonuclease V subunit alpha [Lamprobacter modestohalophilus]MEA1051277.1 exodeoxyribonuclease V subunit alpha [Lamprobacter modestohalophilus]